jgi:hypothetical protein
MMKAQHLIAATAISGMAALAVASSAAALPSTLAAGSATFAVLAQGAIQEVHGWHCQRRWSKRSGWHQHERACAQSETSGKRHNYSGSRGFIPGHVRTPYGYADCQGWWEQHSDGRMECHGILVRERLW